MRKAKTKKIKKRKSRATGGRVFDVARPYQLLLAAGCLAILVSRIHFLPIPFDRDEGAYGYLGWMALTGGTPYVDFYEMKPPLLFYSYAAIVAVFGKLPIGLHLASLCINAFAALMIYKIGNRVWAKPGGAIATLVFVVLGAIPQAGGYGLLSEHIVLLYALPGLLLTIEGSRSMNVRDLYWGGFLLACSALTKQTAILYCIGGIVILALYIFPLRRWDSTTLIKSLSMFVAGAVTPLAFFFIVLLGLGALDDFWYWFYEHPLNYASTRTWDDGKELLIFNWKRISDGHWFWILLSLSGLLSMPFIKTLDWRYKIFLPVFGALGFLTIVPGMRFYGHYWLLFFPAWALLAPGCLILMGNYFSSKKSKIKFATWMPVLILTIGIGSQFITRWDYYFKSDVNEISKQVYRGNFFPEHKVIGDFLNNRMKPGDQLIVMGSEPQIYLYTNKKSPSRHFYMTFTSKVIPEAAEWEEEAIRSIEESKPEYIVFMYEPITWMFKENSTRKLYNWAHSYARAQYRTIGHMDLYINDQVNTLLTDSEAVGHSPQTPSVITIYERIR